MDPDDFEQIQVTSTRKQTRKPLPRHLGFAPSTMPTLGHRAVEQRLSWPILHARSGSLGRKIKMTSRQDGARDETFAVLVSEIDHVDLYMIEIRQENAPTPKLDAKLRLDIEPIRLSPA
ncbi:MAG: hypothetical protein IPM54_12115 [Polyangiaceae bacterium]|nr:hypothetical protein [Polyangiaceae bacterium]